MARTTPGPSVCVGRCSPVEEPLSATVTDLLPGRPEPAAAWVARWAQGKPQAVMARWLLLAVAGRCPACPVGFLRGQHSSSRVWSGVELLWSGSDRVVGGMRVAFGTDEQAPLVQAVIEELARQGHEVTVLAPGAQWPEVGRAVGQAVAGGVADVGVVCCWTGTGVSIAANKVRGARAALCTDAETARGARRWNDANVLALSLRLTSPEVAREILAQFLGTSPDPGEEVQIAEISRIEDDSQHST